MLLLQALPDVLVWGWRCGWADSLAARRWKKLRLGGSSTKANLRYSSDNRESV